MRWYGTVEDIDDRKKAEEALRASEARLQAIFDAVPVGLIIAEAPSGRIVKGNPQAEKILRSPVVPRQKIDAFRQSGAFHADGRQMDPRDYPLARAILRGETTGGEEFLYHAEDGSYTWLSATAAPVRGQDGKVTGGVLAIQDIDATKRERQRLRDLVEKLKSERDQKP